MRRRPCISRPTARISSKGADGVDYKPITFGGGAAYAFFKTSKSGKLVITATQGKVAADGKDCKLGIKVNGTSQSDDDVALEPYDLEKPLLDAKVYEWNIENTTGNVQEIQIVKVGGSTSPWIYDLRNRLQGQVAFFKGSRG